MRCALYLCVMTVYQGGSQAVKLQCGLLQGESNTSVEGAEGDTWATPGRWPWVARLLYRDIYTRNLCSGALISARHVVTTAGCLHHNTLGGPTAVMLGETDVRYEYDYIH